MESLKKIISDIRQKADECHNNNGDRTHEDWERMSQYLLGIAGELAAVEGRTDAEDGAVHGETELKRLFGTMEDLRKKAYKIAPLCTDICNSEEIHGMWLDGADVEILVWSSNCGNDHYEIPLEYFSMSAEEVESAERKRMELERKRLIEEEKREAKRKKKAKEARERRTYERLKRKFG